MMRFFRRRSSDATLHAGHNVAGKHTSTSHPRALPTDPSYPMHLNRRPTFGQWLKATWPDFLTMVIMGAIALGVNFANPIYPSMRLFPIDGPESRYISYPMVPPHFTSAVAGITAIAGPLVVITLLQLRIRSFWDWNNAVLGLLFSIITGSLFQVLCKTLIGGLRPHFLDACRPDRALIAANPSLGRGYANTLFDPSICTGDPGKIKNALISFPSGHTEAFFAGFIYLVLYLNAKLKTYSNISAPYWKLIATFFPLLCAVVAAADLVMTFNHHWYDVGFGAAIGALFAVAAFRSQFASVFDFRFNHVPLSRRVGYGYAVEEEGSREFGDAVVTRRKGWREGLAGAPGDANMMGAGLLPMHRGSETSHGAAIQRKPLPEPLMAPRRTNDMV